MAQDNMAAGAVNLEGRSAIVTGAGSGIGRAMALTFARAGAEVMVNDIIATRADETVAMIEKDGGKAVAAIADIADETAVGSFVDAAMRPWGKIDILCNNASIMNEISLIEVVSPDLWKRVLPVNVKDTFFVAREVM